MLYLAGRRGNQYKKVLTVSNAFVLVKIFLSNWPIKSALNPEIAIPSTFAISAQAACSKRRLAACRLLMKGISGIWCTISIITPCIMASAKA